MGKLFDKFTKGAAVSLGPFSYNNVGFHFTAGPIDIIYDPWKEKDNLWVAFNNNPANFGMDKFPNLQVPGTNIIAYYNPGDKSYHLWAQGRGGAGYGVFIDAKEIPLPSDATDASRVIPAPFGGADVLAWRTEFGTQLESKLGRMEVKIGASDWDGDGRLEIESRSKFRLLGMPIWDAEMRVEQHDPQSTDPDSEIFVKWDVTPDVYEGESADPFSLTKVGSTMESIWEGVYTSKFGAQGMVLASTLGLAVPTLIEAGLAGLPGILTAIELGLLIPTLPEAILVGAIIGLAIGAIAITNGKSFEDLFTAAVEAPDWGSFWNYLNGGSYGMPSPRQADPLAIDLDGDGIETRGTTEGTGGDVLFDHDGDGVKTATGWVASDDAWLVIDKNGNGTIDNGGELFGVNYVKADGTFADTGLDAISDVDSNADGVIDALDPVFEQIKVWRDYNQDGISQTTELTSLADRDITAISYLDPANSADAYDLGNGNSVNGTARYLKQDGTIGLIGNLNLIQDASEAAFTPIDISAAAALPDMQGSGAVRGLREAMTLDDGLRQLVQDFVDAPRLDDKRAIVFDIVMRWAASATGGSTFHRSMEENIPLYIRFNGDVHLGMGASPAIPQSVANTVTANGGSTSGGTSVQVEPVYTYGITNSAPTEPFSWTNVTAQNFGRLVDHQKFGELLASEAAVLGVTGHPDWYKQVMLYSENPAIAAYKESIMPYIVMEVLSGESLTDDRIWAERVEGYNNSLAKSMGYAMDFPVQAAQVNGMRGVVREAASAVYGTLLQQTYFEQEIALASQAINAAAEKSWAKLDWDDINDTVIRQLAETQIMLEMGDAETTGTAAKQTLEDINKAIHEKYKDIKADLKAKQDAGLAITDLERLFCYQKPIERQIPDQTALNSYLLQRISDAWQVQKDPALLSNMDIDGRIAALRDIALEIDDFMRYFGKDLMRAGWDPSGLDQALQEGINDLASLVFNETDYSPGGIHGASQFSPQIYDYISDHVYAGLSTQPQQQFFYYEQPIYSVNPDTGIAVIEYYEWHSVPYVIPNEGTEFRTISSPGLNWDFGMGDDIICVKSDATVAGGSGNDIYFVNENVHLTIGSSFDNKSDSLSFGPKFNLDNIWVERSGSDLLIRNADSSMTVLVKNHFMADGEGDYSIGEISFANGFSIDKEGIRMLVVDNGDNGGTLTGYASDDLISGDGGNDIIHAKAGNDMVSGGADNDMLYGEAGHDYLLGGAGNDTLQGGADDDILYGNEGDDVLRGGTGNDAYSVGVFGNDTILDDGGTGDRIVFDGPLTPTNVVLRRNAVNDLIITSTLSDLSLSGQTTVQGYFTEQGKIEELQFADQALLATTPWAIGEIWDANTVKQKVLLGTNLNDTIYAFDEADLFSGLGGNDTLYARAGNDTVYGGEGQDTIYGDGGDDDLFGDLGGDTLYGGEGNDLVNGGEGDDTLNGGAGDDAYILAYGFGMDTVVESTGANDKIRILQPGITLANITLSRVGNDLLVTLSDGSQMRVQNNFPVNGDAISFIESVEIYDGTTTVMWDMNAILARTLLGTASQDVIYGFNTGDTIEGHGGNDQIFGKNGNDTVFGGAGLDTLNGEGDNDYLFGDGENDTLSGGEGNDVLDGGTENDYLYGGAGDDAFILRYGRGIDTIIESSGANDRIRIIEPALNPASVVLSRSGNDLLVTLIDGSQMRVQNNFPANGDAASAIEFIEFADGTVWDANAIIARTQQGTASGDTLIGFNTGEWLMTYGGYDTVYAKGGNDTVLGGSGNDTLNGEDDNDQLYGEEDHDVLNGGNGNDLLDGGIGNDTLRGNADDDTYVLRFGYGTDTVIESGGANDRIRITQSGITPADITLSRLGNDLLVTLSDGSKMQVTGNFPADGARISAIEAIEIYDGSTWVIWEMQTIIVKTLSGTVSADNLTGYATGETINAYGGNDTVYGGDGNDTVYGGSGSDTLYGQGDSDYLRGEGNNDILYGGGGGDILDGGSGADSMRGEMGDDTYLVDEVGDAVIENDANGGVDTVQSAITYTLGNNVENLILTGNAAINGTGNELGNTLTGNAAANILTGGLGDDTYYVMAGDTVVEGSGAGWDTVNSYVSWTLGNYQEDLILIGSAAINGTGNEQDNYLTGNSAANVLRGGLGSDTYYVSTGDTVIENSGEGWDTVISNVSWALGNYQEELILSGTAAIDGTGNGQGNILTGNTGANILRGGGGNDFYSVSTGDTVIEYSSEGTDTVLSNVSWVLGNNVENLTLTGAGAINGTGNGQDNTLRGNTLANILDGGIGADVMEGGRDDDTYVIDNVGDVVTEYTNEGIDILRSSVTFTLSNHVETLILTGSNVINGTGNAGDNLIKGNGASNTLNGAGGADILQGGGGSDTLTDTSGKNMFDGGSGNDTITGGAGNEFIAGGAGNDTITTGTGADVIAFNRGDGQDSIAASTGTDNTLSLGKGITYADLSFQKSANDLILVTGAGEQVTFKDWYADVNNHSVANLQIVIEGTSDYNAASSNQLNNKKIEQFNFNGLVTAFDQARAANPTLTSWGLSSSLLSFYLSGSDTAASGGDLAYQYAMDGNWAAVSMTPALALLNSTQFGTANQNRQKLSALQDSSPRLM